MTLGTPVVAYDKPLKGSLVMRLRLECRVKPRRLGYQLAQIKNPFAGVQLLTASFSESSGIGIPAQLIADSIRIGGLKRALLALGPEQRKALKKAYKDASSLLPKLDEAWAGWPGILASCGLGNELGAMPVMTPGTGVAVNCKPAATGALAANVPMQSTVLIKYSEGAMQP